MSSSSPNSSSPPLSSFNLQYENNLNIITSINSSPNIPTTKAFICEICNKAFRFRSNLAEHRSVHTAVKPFVCKFCGKSSRLKGNLTKHILKHHKNEQRDYIGTDDYIIKKGKKSVKDPAAIEFLERSMIVLNNSSSANNAKQRNSKESDSKESSVNLDNNDINNEINTDNLFNSLGFNNSFEMKEEENNDQQALASSPLTPENENSKGEEQNVMSVVALMAAAAASSSSCPAFLENNTNEDQNEDMEEDEEEEEIEAK
uniref:C2H2-type domain-containing protein n=1 Tax=Meloidogyne incognita TaxID=6306 RepID=A0A914L4Z7_MELIC